MKRAYCEQPPGHKPVTNDIAKKEKLRSCHLRKQPENEPIQVVWMFSVKQSKLNAEVLKAKKTHFDLTRRESFGPFCSAT